MNNYRRIRRMGKVLFHGCMSVHRREHKSQVLSQVFGPKSFLGEYPSPMFFPWSLVLGPFWWGTQSQPGGTLERIGYPLAGTGVPPSWVWGTCVCVCLNDKNVNN